MSWAVERSMMLFTELMSCLNDLSLSAPIPRCTLVPDRLKYSEFSD